MHEQEQQQTIPSCPPPSYNTSILSSPQYNPNPLDLENRFRTIVQKYEISHLFAHKLQILKSFKIVFVIDDSGSMNSTLNDSPLNNPNSLMKATRWDECLYFANISIEIASIFNPQGCDIYFLNRFPSPVKNIIDSSQLVYYFEAKPQGFTPLTHVVRQVLNENQPQVLGERKLLIIIVTDGEPTDHNGKVNINQFKQCLLSRHKNVYTNIVACTDDDTSVSYLNKWDRKMTNLDVIDDYRSEKNEIIKEHGKKFSFTFGDYVVKSLIGSIDPELDNFDESKNCICSIV